MKLLILLLLSVLIPAFALQQSKQRRQVLQAAALTLVPFLPQAQAAHATRAVGVGEFECRQQGNCLEKGEWDGAIGWSWGGKDRCDATDPNCGTNGQTINTESATTSVAAVPTAPVPIVKKFTSVIQIGRQESLIINFGLYEEPYVDTIISFLTTGFFTKDSLASSAPLSLQGGQVTRITPNKIVELGILKQSQVYAKARGRIDPDFVPQPRPPKQTSLPVLRSHDSAGLISIPKNGLGYGGTGFENDDEAFESSILLTAAPAPNLDATHCVIGQVTDEASLQALFRIARIPTNKGGVRGVLPGQVDGPPLVKTTIGDIQSI